MKNLLIALLLTLFSWSLTAQVIPAKPTDIVKGVYHGKSRPLREIPPMSAEEFRQLEKKGLTRTLNKDLKNRIFPFAETALPKGPDPIRQDFMGTRVDNQSLQLNFDGQTSPYYPPDCNGTAGPDHFMQTINTVYAIYDKAGTLVAGPTNMNQLFGNVPGANRNDGDPIMLYDEQADRWLATEFSIPFSGPNYILMAVSTTNDPTGTWHTYSFQVASMPDYPKFSVWQDGYYMGVNNSSGNDIYVFERNKMLNGEPAQAVGFNNPWRPTSVDGFMCVPPLDNDGAYAPGGTPGMFIAFNDDALGGGSDQLWLYELTVDWNTTANSTFLRTQQIDVQPFNSNFGNNWNNIDQKGTNQRVDAIPQVIMNVPQYRNFGTHQTIVCCHTVNIDEVRHAGIRWYELRKTAADWEIRQQSTYAPDEHSRWMGSMAMNGSGEIGLGYSVSSTEIHPGILYCGQSAGANALANGILDMAEDTIWEGSASQTGANRWGDYSQVSVDPSDDKTFWFTTQYVGSGGSRKTRIASFRYAFGPEVVTMPATNILMTSATLNATINPNGQETNYHFEYGLTPASLTNTTPVVSAGAGTSPVNVSEVINGLTENTVYYYRIVAESIGGNASGLKVKFTTAMAPFLLVDPPIRNVTPEQGETTFHVSSNVDWNVESDALWCICANPSGSGSDTIIMAYEENKSALSRSASVMVFANSLLTRTVVVNQDGAAAILSVIPDTVYIQAAGGNTQLEVISNASWIVSCDQAWCEVTPFGMMNQTITATADENFSVLPRYAVITVSADGISPVNAVLVQEGAAVILSVTPENRNVTADAGTTDFSVIANTDWTALSDASWCTITASGTGSGTIVADYTQNTLDQQRIASINVKAGPSVGYTVTVTQEKRGIGIDEAENTSIQLLPNPSGGQFRLVLPTGYHGFPEVVIRDMTGKVVVVKYCTQPEDLRFDLSGMAVGTYQVTIRNDQSTVIRKLVIF